MQSTNRCTLISDDIRKKILSGQFQTGERLPSERDLEQQYGISRVTVSKAIMRLRTEGLVCRRWTPSQGPPAGVIKVDPRGSGGPR